MDYGIALKIDSGSKVFNKLLSLLKVLLMLAGGRSNAYSQSICMHFMQLLYQQSKNLPSWTMLKESVDMFNEEPGEISFSVLGRAVTGDANRKEIKMMKEQWLRIQQHREFDEAMREEIHGDEAIQTNWRKQYRSIDPEVGAAREFMRARIREIKGGTYRVYRGLLGGAYYNKTQADKHMQPFTRAVPMWKADTTDYLKLQLDTCSKFVSAWAAPYGHIWPAFALRGPALDEHPEPRIRDDEAERKDEHFEDAAEPAPVVDPQPVVAPQNKRRKKRGGEAADRARHGKEEANSPRSPSPRPVAHGRKGPSPTVPEHMMRKHLQRPVVGEREHDPRDWNEWGRLSEKMIVSGKRKNRGVRHFDRHEMIPQDPFGDEDHVICYSSDTEEVEQKVSESDGE